MSLFPFISGKYSGTGIVPTTPLRIAQFENGTNYNAWGVAIPHTVGGVDVIDYFYSCATHHAGKATSRRLRVTSAGVFVEDVELYSHSTLSRRDFGGGITSGGTMIIFYVENNYDISGNYIGATGMGYYRSTDGFATYTTYNNVLDTTGDTDYANYGNLAEHPVTGRLYHIAYGTNPASRLRTYVSDDDGITWTLLSVTPHANQYSEGSVAFLSGTTNANAKLAYFVRNDVSSLGFFRSTDGGSSFSLVEELTWTATASKAAWVTKRPDNGNIILSWTDRASQDYVIRCAEFNPTLLETGSAIDARLSYRTSYESFINSHTPESSNLPGNFGYFTIAFQSGKEPVLMGYDQSPYQQMPWGTANDIIQCDTIFVPYEGDVWVKARQVPSSLTFPNGETNLTLDDTVVDNYGAWNSYQFTAPKTATYDVRINFPISCNNGATKVLNMKKNGVTINTITETDGNIGTLGKLQDGFSVALVTGDILSFTVTVTGATSSPVMQGLTTPQTGIAYSIDITSATALSGNVRVRVSASSQAFTNSVPQQISGTETTDTHTAWASNQFTVPKTAWYKIRVHQRFPSAGGGRRIIEVYNYEVGQEAQETRRKRLYQIEDKGRGGTNTDTDGTFYYRLNKGETVKFWFTIYGADVTSVSGAFNCIEIDEI